MAELYRRQTLLSMKLIDNKQPIEIPTNKPVSVMLISQTLYHDIFKF